MAMSKKDYQAIARAIHETRVQDTDHATDARGVLTLVADRLADALRADNPRFNRALFVEACETGRCRGMKG